MKIRNTITLWITGAGVVAGLLFSIVIAVELIEQPYELLDGELASQAYTVLAGIAPHHGGILPQPEKIMLESLGRLYWFKIHNQGQELIYASAMTHFTDLPIQEKQNGYNVHAAIPEEAASLEQDDSNEVTFRVRMFTLPFEGEKYRIQIARPMERLQEEITDLIITIIAGLVVYTITLLLAGYLAAGRILKPIADINILAREINDKTLDKRIPLPHNRDELYTLSASLNTMFDRLQYSFQRQKELIANASHELKTPIAMQRLFFNEAQQRQDLPGDFVARLAPQIRSLYRMDRLVKNLLDLSALELNECLEPAEVDLSEMAASVVQEYNEIIQSAGIHLTTDMQKDIHIQADEDKIRRTLINLIDNAIKYNSGKNKEIRFKLARDRDQVSIEIYNSGQGIPKEDLKLVFSQFYRVDKSRAAALGGSGLGLTIVKRIIELHHGSIEINSEPGSGVRVSILLPVSQDRPVK